MSASLLFNFTTLCLLRSAKLIGLPAAVVLQVFCLHHGGPNATPRLPTHTASRRVAPPDTAAAPLSSELERLAALHDAGVLDDSEFKIAKQQVLQRGSR